MCSLSGPQRDFEENVFGLKLSLSARVAVDVGSPRRGRLLADIYQKQTIGFVWFSIKKAQEVFGPAERAEPLELYL